MWKSIGCTVLLLIIFSGCTSVEHINYFYMRGLPTSTFLPRPVDSIPAPRARISGGIQYSRINFLEYYDDKNPPDSISRTSGNSSNIHWHKPPLVGSFSADFGPLAKVVSVSTQTDGAVMDYEFFINFKVGPSVQYSTKYLGIRGDFIFSIGNYYCSYEYITYSGFLFPSLDKYNQSNVDGTSIGFSPHVTLNTLREYLYLNYYLQAGYHLQLLLNTPFVSLPYATLSLGLYKNISNWQLLSGARFAFVTKFNYYGQPQTPVFPTFFFNVAYNVNLKKSKVEQP